MDIITKLYRRFVIGNINNFNVEPDVDKWMAFIDGLPKPKDYIDASYNKYKCRNFYFPKYKILLLNIASIPGALKAVIGAFGEKNNLPKVIKGKVLVEKKNDVSICDIIPNEIYEKNPIIETVTDSRITGEIKDAAYSKEAKDIFLNVVKRHPFSFYYICWIGRELKKHSQYITKHRMETTVVYIEERNIASPVLKALYEENGRQYVSFMHGEYLLQLIQGYMWFSKYYIWDEMYRNMFSRKLKCNIDKYVIYTPAKFKKCRFEGISQEYYCTYYFSSQSNSSIRMIGEIFHKLEKKGLKCKVRPHPRDSKWNVINEVFPPHMIELPKEVPIEESLKSTRYVVGLASTVMSEAYYAGKEIIIDDVTSPDKFENLKKRFCIILKRRHYLLSKLLKQI